MWFTNIEGICIAFVITYETPSWMNYDTMVGNGQDNVLFILVIQQYNLSLV
jgi:hypothetical protein